MPGLQPGQATRAGRAEYHLQSYNDLSAEHPVRQATIGPPTDLLPTGGQEFDRRVPRPAWIPPRERERRRPRFDDLVHLLGANPGRVADCHPQGRDETLEAGHDAGWDPIGSLGHVPCQAEHVLELVSRDKELLRRKVNQGTQCNESGCRLVEPDALGRVDEPAEPQEDAEQHLADGQGLPGRGGGKNQIVQIGEDLNPHVAQKTDGVTHERRTISTQGLDSQYRNPLAEMGVHVAAIPYEPPLASPVQIDPEGQDANQVAASARLHDACRGPCLDGFGAIGGLAR